MVKKAVAVDDWRRLYDAAIRIKTIAPWQWMEESDIFGVKDPDSDALAFVSVMGMAGEHYALAAYLGADGLYGFWGLQDENLDVYPERVLEVPQLQISFEDREELDEPDRALIKELGYKFRGKKSYPMFRSYKAGFMPWPLDAKEARFFANILEQAIDVALRCKDDKQLLEFGDDEDSYFMRVPEKEKKAIIWHDKKINIPPPEPETLPLDIDESLLASVKNSQRVLNSLEMDLFMAPTPVQEKKNQRPRFPYMLLIIEAESSMMLNADILHVENSLNEMWAMLPGVVLQNLSKLGVIPARIIVRQEIIAQLLEFLAEELKFEIILTDALPGIDTAKDFMLNMLG